MDTLHILDMPDDILFHIFKYMDKKTQCKFAFTCLRFRNIYETVYKNRFVFFDWSKTVDNWSGQEIDEFFQLNGYKIRRLSVSDLDVVHLAIPSVTHHLANVCVYLKNVKSLMLSIHNNLNGVIIGIYHYMKKLEDLVIDCPHHSNYECLVLLPNLRSFHIYHDVCPFDRLFQRVAEVRPNTLEHLRLGAKLKMEQGRIVECPRSLKRLIVKNPCFHFFHRLILQSTSLRVLSITSGDYLKDDDFRCLIMHLKFLDTLFVNKCSALSTDFILFLIQDLKDDVRLGINDRCLPFHLQISATRVTHEVAEIETVKSSSDLLKVTVLSVNDGLE